MAVRNFFEEGIMPEGINDTAIVLIPKGTAIVFIKETGALSKGISLWWFGISLKKELC
jgi:hypothetical protein